MTTKLQNQPLAVSTGLFLCTTTQSATSKVCRTDYCANNTAQKRKNKNECYRMVCGGVKTPSNSSCMGSSFLDVLRFIWCEAKYCLVWLEIFKCTWVKCLLETNLAPSVKPSNKIHDLILQWTLPNMVKWQWHFVIWRWSMWNTSLNIIHNATIW